MAGIQGEPSNLVLPASFEEFAGKYDTNHDGLIAFEEIPDDLLFTDRQTSGGYVKIATVISVDLPLIAQALPGCQVRFQAIDLKEAQALLIEREKKD